MPPSHPLHLLVPCSNWGGGARDRHQPPARLSAREIEANNALPTWGGKKEQTPRKISGAAGRVWWCPNEMQFKLSPGAPAPSSKQRPLLCKLWEGGGGRDEGFPCSVAHMGEQSRRRRRRCLARVLPIRLGKTARAARDPCCALAATQARTQLVTRRCTPNNFR